MRPVHSLAAAVIVAAALAGPLAARSRSPRDIRLVTPRKKGGMPLLEALSRRHTSREFAGRALPRRVLSTLLWAAFGINRPDLGKRTAPSAKNWQDVDIYVALKQGLYLYDAKRNRLVAIARQDIRAKTGKQPFVAEAPVNLIYVSDLKRIGDIPEDQKRFYSATDTAFIAQNVYLYCASEGLATVVRGGVPREELHALMKLSPTQVVTLCQTVGYPAAKKR